MPPGGVPGERPVLGDRRRPGVAEHGGEQRSVERRAAPAQAQPAAGDARAGSAQHRLAEGEPRVELRAHRVTLR